MHYLSYCRGSSFPPCAVYVLRLSNWNLPPHSNQRPFFFPPSFSCWLGCFRLLGNHKFSRNPWYTQKRNTQRRQSVCSTALLLLYERERAVWLESVCLFHLSVPLLLALGPGTFSLFLPFFLYIHNTTSHIYTQRDRKEKSSSRSLHSFFFFFSVFFFWAIIAFALSIHWLLTSERCHAIWFLFKVYCS